MVQIGVGEGNSLSSNILRIDDQRITSIPDRDNGERLIPIGTLPRMFLPSMLHTKIEGVQDGLDLTIREGVRERFVGALELLPQKYGLVLIEGHRSFQYQEQLYKAEEERLRQLYSGKGIEEEQLKSIARQFVSDPHIFSPHVTGGALDIALVDVEKNDYSDVGNLFQHDDTAETEYRNLTHSQAENRKLLGEVMTKAGFVNYKKELWHWSYGDKLWAFLNGKKEAIYGPMV